MSCDLPGSQPVDAKKPAVLHPELLPTVMSCKTPGFAYCVDRQSSSSIPSDEQHRTHQDTVYESDTSLAYSDTFFIYSVEDCGKNWCCCARATDQRRNAIVHDDNVVANGADVGITTAGNVVKSTLSHILGGIV